MLFLLFGSSAAGKTFAIDALRERAPEKLAIHDFDEVGVPPDADAAWRQRMNEVWVSRALEYQAEGIDLLLAGQTPLGELLASSAAPLLEGVSACLFDCDETRLARLGERPHWRRTGRPEEWPDLLNWAGWMRRHGEDFRPPVRVIDTSNMSVEQVVDELSAWIEDERSPVSR